MASARPGYRTIYNVGLLDDLHNYFPDLLYNHGRFQNLTQVFHYVRVQINRRFNLYAYGAQEHMESMSGIGSVPLAPPVPQTPAQTPAQTVIHEIPSPRLVSVREVNENLQAANLLMSLFGASLDDGVGVAGLGVTGGRGVAGPTPLRRPPAADIWTNFRQPVIVRPTQEAIRRGSEELIGSSLPAGSVCTICQDTIGQIDVCRKIRFCNHAFHKVCIDQWFERSVLCPTCRHDIREPLTS